MSQGNQAREGEALASADANASERYYSWLRHCLVCRQRLRPPNRKVCPGACARKRKTTLQKRRRACGRERRAGPRR